MLAGGPQAGRSGSSTLERVKGMGTQQRHDDDDLYFSGLLCFCFFLSFITLLFCVWLS